MDLYVIKQIVKNEMGDRRSSPYNEVGEKYYHGERTAKLVIRLRQLIFPEDKRNDDILTVSAWFHDICNGIGDRATHAARGAERARELLAGHCTAGELNGIRGIISAHDDRRPLDKNSSNALKLHQDADHLDHFGTMDIWRFITFTTGHNQTINEGISYLLNNWPNDTVRWRSELHFDLSKKIFDEKTAYVRSFIERFAVENEGAIWKEDYLIRP